MPNVSIIIPTYNRYQFLLEAITSVFHQTYQDFEIIVVDDGSTDNTEDILCNFDDRVRYFKQKNSGSAVARNRGILNSKGNYIAFLDSDDLWYPQKLEKQIEVFQKYPNVGFVFSDFSRGNSIQFPAPIQGFFSSIEFTYGDLFPLLSQMNPIGTSSFMCRSEVVCYSGLMDHTLRRAQDIDFWRRIASVTEAFFLREVLVHMREHPNRISHNTDYLYDVCRQSEIQVYRWAFCNKDIIRNFKKRTSELYYQLSYVERKKGQYHKSYLSLCKSMNYMKNPYRYWPRAILTRFLPFVFKIYDRLMRVQKPVSHSPEVKDQEAKISKNKKF